MTKEALRVALVQSGTDLGSFDDSRERSMEMARSAFTEGADLVVLPELCVPGYTTDAEVIRTSAEPLDGPTVAGWAEVAREHHGLICGGFAEADEGRFFNTAVLVGSDGIELHYRKLHPFNTEKGIFTEGDLGLPVVEVSWGRVGICVCYDLRFVEVVRALTLKGADIVCVPTAWVKGFDEELWDEKGFCPQAHGAILQANLSQVFIACASQVGASGPWRFLGSSVLASPFGDVIAGPLSGTSPEVSISTIDLREVDRAQNRGPGISPRTERRVDVYGLKVGDQVL